MSKKEKHSREGLITFLMREMNVSRQESQSYLEELEQFGLVTVQPSGKFYLKVV